MNLSGAREVNPELAVLRNSIGVSQSAAGNVTEADTSLREALRIDRYHAAANANLARLLTRQGDLAQAVYYFDRAARVQPDDAVVLYEYAHYHCLDESFRGFAARGYGGSSSGPESGGRARIVRRFAGPRRGSECSPR